MKQFSWKFRPIKEHVLILAVFKFGELTRKTQDVSFSGAIHAANLRKHVPNGLMAMLKPSDFAKNLQDKIEKNLMKAVIDIFLMLLKFPLKRVRFGLLNPQKLQFYSQNLS